MTSTIAVACLVVVCLSASCVEADPTPYPTDTPSVEMLAELEEVKGRMREVSTFLDRQVRLYGSSASNKVWLGSDGRDFVLKRLTQVRGHIGEIFFHVSDVSWALMNEAVAASSPQTTPTLVVKSDEAIPKKDYTDPADPSVYWLLAWMTCVFVAAIGVSNHYGHYRATDTPSTAHRCAVTMCVMWVYMRMSAGVIQTSFQRMDAVPATLMAFIIACVVYGSMVDYIDKVWPVGHLDEARRAERLKTLSLSFLMSVVYALCIPLFKYSWRTDGDLYNSLLFSAFV